MYRHFCFVCLFMLSIAAWAQAEVDQRRTSVQFHVENDYFTLREPTDRYFTNGLKVEILRDNWFQKFGTNQTRLPIFALVKPSPYRFIVNGLSLGQDMYTPADITQTQIDTSDRPYAGHLYLSLKSISTDVVKRNRMTSELSLGVLGPYAFAGEAQTWWHEEVLPSPEPKGWHNQIPTDVGINYYVRFQQEVFTGYSDALQVLPHAEANLGTVSNNMGLGGTVYLGWFNDQLVDIFGLTPHLVSCTDVCHPSDSIYNAYVNHPRRKLQFYLFVEGTGRAVLDNSFLQGGLFSAAKSPHTINVDNLNRFYFQGEYGVRLAYGNLVLTASQVFRTPEFKGAKGSQWGALTLAIRF